ncbi:MAG: P-loop NTPase [Candidatus Nezhaarchaeales archaeon]
MKAVCVASGKGGVGKSLISINLAAELARKGVKVGLIDADISNPTIYQMLGIGETDREALFISDKKFRPLKFSFGEGEFEVFSIESFSRGEGIYKVGSEYARILTEMVKYGAWDSDIFVVDSPAGLGDVHKITVAVFDERYAGTIVVGVQNHYPEVRRVLEVHKINDIPVIGLIENMSGFTCECGRTYNLFSGSVSLENIAEEYGVPFFGRIPLDYRIQKNMPWIPRDLMKPVEEAVDIVISSQPRRPGFLTEIKEFMKDSALRLVVSTIPRLLLLINKVVPIREIQQKYNLPGNRIILLNLMEPDMVKVLKSFYFKVKDGKIVMVENVDPFKTPPYASIEIYYKALAWAIVGQKKDGTPYDFWKAFWNDHIRVHTTEGPENMQAFFFLSTCIEYVKNYAGDELRRIMEVLI